MKRFVSGVLIVLATVSVHAAEPGVKSTAGLSPEEAAAGFVSLFDGKTLAGWQGDAGIYVVEDGILVCKPGHYQRLSTAKEYGDFAFRFEFRQQPGTEGNNGIAIRSPLRGTNIEIQIYNEHHPRAPTLKPYQHHGSIYSLVPAKTGHMKPEGQWNSEEILCQGSKIKVTLNGAVIVDADLATLGDAAKNQRARTKGYLGLLGHHDRVEFRNLRIKEL